MEVLKLMAGILASLPDLINISITASYIILAVILVRFIFEKAPKYLICAMWGIAAVRLVCPFSIESVFSLIPAAQTIQTETLRYQGTVLHSPAVIDIVTNPIYPKNLSVELGTSIGGLGDKITLFTFIWLAGVISMLLYAAASALALKKKVSTATLLESGIRQTDAIDSPFLFGMIKPVIYVPYSLAESDLEYVIAHEKAHIKRGDQLWKPLGFIILSVYWFNPLIWLAYILLCRDIEAACDEKVIADMQDEDRRLYSEALLNCSVKRPIVSACPLAFGEVSVKDRIKNVMDYKKPAFWIVAAALVLCIVLALCFLTDPYDGPDGKLGVSMDMAVREQNRSAHSADNFAAVDYDIMRVSKSSGITTVYAWVYYAEYSFDGKEIHKEQASSIPCAITFDTSENVGSIYNVIEYWEPRDGSYYTESIRSKFPAVLWLKAMNNSHIEEQQANCLKAANDYYSKAAAEEALQLSEEAIAEAIDRASMEYYEKNVPDSNICVTSHEILDIAVNEQANTVTAYAWVLYERYEPKLEGDFVVASVGYGFSGPVALTFAVDPDKHEIESLIEYWTASDGREYTNSIKKKFSAAAWKYLSQNESDFVKVLCEENLNKANAAFKQLTFTQKSFDALVDEICSSPQFSSSSRDYINAHPVEYANLLQYGELGLQYIYKEFLEGGQSGLRGHILWAAMLDLAPDSALNITAYNGQDYFDLWLAEAQRLCRENGKDWMEKFRPSMFLLLEMIGE